MQQGMSRFYLQTQFKINNVIFEQMGNATAIDNRPHAQASNKKGYFREFKETHMKFAQIAVYLNTKGQFFIGKEVDLPQSYNQHLLKKQQITQQAQVPQTKKVILPIEHFEFYNVLTVCTQQQKCLVLSRKPDKTLREVYIERKSRGQAFRVSEINSIITRIAQALSIQQQSQVNLQLEMESIVFLDGKAYLLDSLMQDAEGSEQSIYGKYRAPETYRGAYNSEEKCSKWVSKLFSLGIIALCLSFITINVESFVYTKTWKNTRKREVNASQIQNLLTKIKNQSLLNKLSILLSFKPNVRQQIYDLIKQAQMKNQKDQTKKVQLRNSNISTHDQGVDKQNLNMNGKIENHPISQPIKLANNQSFTVVFQREGLKQSTNTIKIAQQLPTNRIAKDSISIVVRPPSKDLNVCKIQSIALSNKQNQLNPYNAGLLKPQLKQTNQRDLIIAATPKKQIKKQKFSTIKEVTEYDECGSITQSKSIPAFQGKFQGKIIDGKKQGYGVFFFEEGSRYQGQWQNDKMHGFGKLFYYGNKLAYEGHWFEGQFHGIGKVYNSEPLILKETFDYTDFTTLTQQWTSYQGQLQQDKRQGWGILRLGNGERFEGEFKEDMLQGYGTFYSLKKEEIKGIWSSSKLVRRQLF